MGEKVYDAACGSAGFLCEAYAYIYDRMEKNTANLKTFTGKHILEKKKNLAYIIGVMNMILHGIEAPNIIHTNTLTENIRDIQEKRLLPCNSCQSTIWRKRTKKSATKLRYQNRLKRLLYSYNILSKV